MQDSATSARTGTIKGYSLLRTSDTYTNGDAARIDLSIRVYGTNGNFPLKVLMNEKNNVYTIKNILF